nr:N-acetyltransferase [Citricoccus sp. CH26A]
MTVRDAREEDHAAIAHLTVASYVDGGHVHPEDAYIEHLQDVAGRAGLARVLVGEVEVGEGRDARRVVAGSVVLTLPGMPMSETARDGEFEFRMLAVDPAVQRRGVARALVRAAIDRAQQLEGIEAVVLTTMETMTSAHRLYESEGFVRVPERDWRLSDIGQEPTDGTDQLYWVFRRPV